MKILIAEDDPVSFHVLRKILIYWKHDVTAVRDGVQALRIIEEVGRPDILISDWNMPRMTGPELCQRLRKDQRNSDIYIIMLTTKDQIADMMKGFVSGVDDYISKPVTESELKQSIDTGSRFLRNVEGYTNREKLISDNIRRFRERFLGLIGI